MSAVAEAVARLRAVLPPDRITSWRAHDALDELEAAIAADAKVDESLAVMANELMRRLDQLCDDCRAMVEAPMLEGG